MERTIRTVEMTFEENEIVVYRRRCLQQTVAWCPQCERRTSLAEPEAAARLTEVTTRIVYQRVEAGSVHFIESTEGELLICIDSLTQEPL